MKDNLFNLVKSLSKAEKRHFKMYSSAKSTELVFIKLFDLIDKQETYNEELIKEQFKDARFTNQLHVVKNYLVKQIQKSLRLYYAEQSRELELKTILSNIEIMFYKEQYGICISEFKRAEKLAAQYEFFSLHLDLVNWKRKLFLKQSGSFDNYDNLMKLLEEEKNLVSKIETISRYWKLVANIPRAIKGKISWEDIMNTSLVRDFSNAASLRAKILFYHIHYSYQLFLDNPQQALIYINKLILMLELQPHRIIEDPSSYVTSLNNKIGLLLDLKQYNTIPPLIEKIRSLPEKYNIKSHSPYAVNLLSRTYNVELELYRDTKQFDRALFVIKSITGFMKEHGELISDIYKQLFYYQIASVCFMMQNYSDALKWTNEIINGKFTGGREDITSYARLLNMLIHFELNNYYVLRYAVESYRRFLKKKRVPFDFEKVLLKFFSKTSTQPKSKHNELIKKLKSELFAKTPGNQRKSVLDYLDFEKWLDEKLQNKN